jgi:hypothetical protein
MFFDRESHSPLRRTRGDELGGLFNFLDRVPCCGTVVRGHHREIVLPIAKGIDIVLERSGVSPQGGPPSSLSRRLWPRSRRKTRRSRRTDRPRVRDKEAKCGRRWNRSSLKLSQSDNRSETLLVKSSHTILLKRASSGAKLGLPTIAHHIAWGVAHIGPIVMPAIEFGHLEKRRNKEYKEE